MLRTLFLPFVLTLLAPPTLAATEAPPPDAGRTFEGHTGVVAVEVPVNVVTKDGEPVRGLTADDFELYDDGDLQPITDFEVVDLEQIQADQLQDSGEIDSVPRAARRYFLLLFDLSFSNPTSLARVRDAALDFVRHSLHPTDLAAVAVFTLETGPRLIVTFTPDRSQLARAIDTLGLPQLLARGQIADPLRFVIEPPGTAGSDYFSGLTSAGGGGPRGGGVSQALISSLQIIGQRMQLQERAYQRSRISAWARSLGEMARALDIVKGRKHVIYFSEGFDGRLLFGRQPSPDDPSALRDEVNIQFGRQYLVDSDQTYGNSNLQSEINDMLEEFRRADCIIQAVDIAGLRASALSSELRDSEVGQDALFYISHETGGELYEDGNNFKLQLERVLSRSTVTYVISFHPQELAYDGSYHRLKVKLADRKGVRSSYRRGYYEPRGYQDLDPLEKSLLASDAIATVAPIRDVSIDVLAAPFKATEELAYVPVIVELDGPSLLRDLEDDSLEVELYAYVTNVEGEVRDFFTQVIGINLQRHREALTHGGLKYYGHLSLGPGQYVVRVLARNTATGRTGVTAMPLLIPEFADQEPTLLPPFFFDEEPHEKWVLVREQRPDSVNAKSMIYPFTVNGSPYIPAAKPALHPGTPARLCLVGYHLGAGDLQLDGEVMTPDGSRLGGGRLQLTERTVTGIEGLDKLLLSFSPEGLAVGDYRLQVAVTDPATGSTETSSIPFSILN